MAKNKLNDKKILIIAICKNELETQLMKDFLKNTEFSLPEGFIFQSIILEKNKNFAVECNSIMRQSDAKYKIFFIHTPLLPIVDKKFILSILSAFFFFPKLKLAGSFGSEMPLTGDYTQAKNFYGVYKYLNAENVKEQKSYPGKIPFMVQSVQMLDKCFFVTSEDITFDERVGDDFFLAAQCCKIRKMGDEVGVLWLDEPGLVFITDECSYKKIYDREKYENDLKKFKSLYKDVFNPLVSVVIPTYNNTEVLKQALESVLNQTYENIEIIIGDDSTNEETKNFIKPYLKKYSNIKYFYHGGPLGGRGVKNTIFILNKAAGKFINLLYHDDIIYPEKISKMMKVFVEDLDNKVGFVSSTRDRIDKAGKFVGKRSTYLPSSDAVIEGEDLGRKLLFYFANFIGEVSTVLFRREDLEKVDSVTGKKMLDIGVFCGVRDIAMGDMSTFLEICKNGKSCVFLAENLSAFRIGSDEDQNTNNPFIMVNLALDMLNFLTLAWLNNVYIHSWEEYKFTCKSWVYFLERYWEGNKVSLDNEAYDDKLKLLINKGYALRDLVTKKKYDEFFDQSISFLLSRLPENNPVRPFIKKNEKTGLWEKAFSEIPLRCEQVV